MRDSPMPPPQVESFAQVAVERDRLRHGVGVSFRAPDLEEHYQARHREQSHAQNRLVILILTVLFDLYFISERWLAMEVLTISAILRFGVLTPSVALFVLLDWRGRIGTVYGWLFPTFLFLPTFLACLESLYVTSPDAIFNFQAVPLIQLVVLAASLSLRQTLLVLLSSSLIFIVSVLTLRFVPRPDILPMILADISLTIGLTVISFRLDRREREVFLFKIESDHQRSMLAEQNRQLAMLTRIDALTGLGNRRFFDEALATLWANTAERGRLVTLILFDIDYFKKYNDSLGHPAGDDCLRAVGRLAERCARGTGDILARYGGEEFALILPDASLDVGCAVAERVRRSVVDRAIPHPGLDPPGIVTISLGVATLSPCAGEAVDLIKAADQGLYAAKRNGRNTLARQDGVQARPSNAAASAGRRQSVSPSGGA